MDIKQKIKTQGFTISEVASKMPNGNGGLGISQPSLSAIINGNPTVNKLKDIADIIGLTLSELVAEDDDSYSQTLACPHCGKRIRVSLTIERDEPRRIASHLPIAEELQMNNDDGTRYRYKNPLTKDERMAILEIQAGPGEDGMCNVINVNPADSDGSEVFDVEFDRLMPM